MSRTPVRLTPRSPPKGPKGGRGFVAVGVGKGQGPEPAPPKEPKQGPPGGEPDEGADVNDFFFLCTIFLKFVFGSVGTVGATLSLSLNENLLERPPVNS